MTTPRTRPFVEVGDPGYGPGMDPADAGDAVVDTDVEGVEWRPRAPRAPSGGEIAFVDGVQQVEAWLTATVPGEPEVVTGLACAVAAGVVVTAPGTRAGIVDLRARRLVFAAGDRALHLPPAGGASWEARAGEGREMTALHRAVGRARQDLEHALAEEHATPERLVVLDGRLTFLRDGAGPVVGAIKSHQRMYLGPDHAAVVGALAVGERTPLFAVGADRYAWYQRLPVPRPQGWAGILRGEVARAHGLARAAELADRATASLPAFAGRPHRDPRAPQNMSPVAGLEAHLRRRLGDRRVALRAVRRAAAGARLDATPVPVAVAEPPEEVAA